MERLRCCVAALWHGAVVLGLACIAPRGLSDCRVAVWGLRLRNAPHHSFVGSRSKMAGEAAPPAATCDTAPMACMTHRAPVGGVLAALQALQRGRAEGRLELIKGDKKKVRVGGAGEGAGERREARWRRSLFQSHGGEGSKEPSGIAEACSVARAMRMYRGSLAGRDECGQAGLTASRGP